MQGEAKHCKAALYNHAVQQEMTRSKASDTWTQSFSAVPGWTKLFFLHENILNILETRVGVYCVNV